MVSTWTGGLAGRTGVPEVKRACQCTTLGCSLCTTPHVVSVVSDAVYDVSVSTEDVSVMIGEGVGERGGLVIYVFDELLWCRSGFGIAVVHVVIFENGLNCLLLRDVNTASFISSDGPAKVRFGESHVFDCVFLLQGGQKRINEGLLGCCYKEVVHADSDQQRSYVGLPGE